MTAHKAFKDIEHIVFAGKALAPHAPPLCLRPHPACHDGVVTIYNALGVFGGAARCFVIKGRQCLEHQLACSLGHIVHPAARAGKEAHGVGRPEDGAHFLVVARAGERERPFDRCVLWLVQPLELQVGHQFARRLFQVHRVDVNPGRRRIRISPQYLPAHALHIDPPRHSDGLTVFTRSYHGRHQSRRFRDTAVRNYLPQQWHRRRHHENTGHYWTRDACGSTLAHVRGVLRRFEKYLRDDVVCTSVDLGLEMRQLYGARS